MKKTVAFILSFIFVFNISVFSELELVTEQNNFADAVDVLKGIGIITADDSFSSDKIITRAEFSVLLARLIIKDADLANNAYGTFFIDLPYNHFASKSIEVVTAIGALNGIGGGLFAPNAPIIYEHAIKAVVSVLGYDLLAWNRGGYPAGYLIIGSEIRLNRNLLKTSGELTWSEASQILYNALDADIMKITSFGDTKEITKVKNENILSNNLNIIKVKGVVTATRLSGLSSDRFLPKNQIEINNKIYNCNNIETVDYLGLNVEAYFNKDKNDNELIYIRLDSSKNNTLELNASDVISFKPGNLKYLDEYGVKSIEFPLDIDIIYNGVAKTLYSEELFKAPYTSIKLVDNNSDNNYNVIFVDCYKSLVVNVVDINNKIIYDTYDKNFNIVLDDTDTSKVIVVKNTEGKNIEISKLKKKDILSFTASENHRVTKVIVSNDTIDGEIEEIEENAYRDFLKITIDGTFYKMNRDFYNLSGKNISVGDYGVFYLDYSNNICGYDSYGENYVMKYGYLIGMAKKQGISDTLEFKIFSESNEMIYASGANRIILDGAVTKTSTEVLDAVTVINASTGMRETICQMIKFNMNGYGEIDVLDTVNEIEDKDSIHLMKSPAKLNYRAGTNTFEGKVMISADTKVFLIPAVGSDDLEYGITNYTYFRADSSYTIAAYGLGEKLLADIILIDKSLDPPTFSSSTPILIIDKITKVIDKFGETAYKVMAYHDGSYVEIFAKDDGGVNDVEQGDIIRFVPDSRGYITKDNITMIFDVSNPSYTSGLTATGTSFTLNPRFAFGNVLFKEGGRIQISDANPLTAEETTKEIHQADRYRILLYDSLMKKNERLKRSSVNDIYDFASVGYSCSKVLVITRQQDARDIIIYK